MGTQMMPFQQLFMVEASKYPWKTPSNPLAGGPTIPLKFHLPASLSPFSCPPAITHVVKTNFCAKLRRKPTLAVAETGHNHTTFSEKAVAKLIAVVGDGSISPLKNVQWADVLKHTAKRLKWVDEGYELLVFTDTFLLQCTYSSSEDNEIKSVLTETDILININVQNHDSVKWVMQNTERIPNVVCFDCSPELRNKPRGLQNSSSDSSILDKISLLIHGNKMESSLEVLRTVYGAWDRPNADDIRYSLLLLINSYARPVPILQSMRAKGFSTLYCMIKNCGPQIVDCLLDPNCRKSLACLNKCAPTDQACSYRCIASYESPKLEAFSLCVLQKHNCLGLNAEIAMKPNVQPLSSFRGRPLNHNVAEDLFVGWLGELKSSWRVVASQNPAYDRFPCQYQLFYRGKARGSFWFEPVFRVQTSDGQIVWRRRRHRVKRGAIPGTFNFSVLDNGVVTKEFWRIVDVADDLSWSLFYYSGAAQAAGQSYAGALLVSPDRSWPSTSQTHRVNSALEKCGIKDWELHGVDNTCCSNPPLGIPEGSSLHLSLQLADSTFGSAHE
eukprot:Gb_32109 [translate_table: standard]